MLKNRLSFVLSFIFCVFLTGCQKEERIQVSEELLVPEQVKYDILEVENGDYVKTSQGSAVLEYPIHTDLSWDSQGDRILEILVRSGQDVKKGDVLITFTSESSRVELEELEIQLLRTQEAFEREKVRRQTLIAEAQLKTEEIYTHQDLRIAVLNIEKQRIDLEQYIYQTSNTINQMKEKISEIREKISNNQLVAPHDGIIDYIINRAGSPVQAGEVLVTVNSTELLLVKANSVEDSLRYNMDVTIETGRGNNIKTYHGKVIAAPNILPGTVECDYALIKTDEELSALDFFSNTRYFANVQDLRDILLIDRNVVIKDNNKSFVYILENDTVQKRYISEGFGNSNKVWVLDGLSKGQSLIMD